MAELKLRKIFNIIKTIKILTNPKVVAEKSLKKRPEIILVLYYRQKNFNFQFLLTPYRYLLFIKIYLKFVFQLIF